MLYYETIDTPTLELLKELLARDKNNFTKNIRKQSLFRKDTICHALVGGNVGRIKHNYLSFINPAHH